MTQLLKPIIDVMTVCLNWFYGLTGNYGVAILLLTLAMRIIILPLTIYQMKSMKAMQELQGPTKELQKKYKDQPEKLNQEMMELYRKHGANPMAGCLPTLVQLPIFWALFGTLEQMNWAASPVFLGLHLNQANNIALGVFVGLVTLLQSLLGGLGGMGTPPQGAQGSQQKIMTYGMPLLFGYFAIKVQAGVGLYYVASTLFGFVQQAIYPGFGKRRAAIMAKGAAQVETGGEERKDDRGSSQPRPARARRKS